MRVLTTMLVVISLCVIFVQSAEQAFGDRPMSGYSYWKLVQDIARDTSTPEKRAQATMILLRIARSDAVHIRLREFAVQKLGELGDIAAAEPLKVLAEQLTWSDATMSLKGYATLAYWQIMVANEKTAQAQEDLLIKLLWSKDHPGPYASGLVWWAADELANRGVERALPEIEKAILHLTSTDRGQRFIKLCSAKIELLNRSASRHEALKKALGSTDPLIGQDLRLWAIEELGKLGDAEAIGILVNYALELQTAYYDEAYRLKKQLDIAYVEAGTCYNMIIGVLRNQGMSDAEIEATGLRPYRCFPSS